MVECPNGSFCCEDGDRESDAIAGTCCEGAVEDLFQAPSGTTVTVIGATGFGESATPTATFSPTGSDGVLGGDKGGADALGVGIGGGIFGPVVVAALVLFLIG